MATSYEETTPFSAQSVAAINLAGSSTNNVIVTGIAGKRIVVLYGWLASGTTATSYLMEDSDGNALTGVITLAANSSHEFVPPKGVQVMKCPTGKSLRIDVGAGDLDGWFVYTLVQAQ